MSQHQSSDPQRVSPSVFKEFALWVAGGLFLSAMALTAVGAARYLVGWNEAEWAVASALVLTFSLTWGSWSALLWTHSRVLKALMVVITMIPGVALALFGAWAFFYIPDNPWVWRMGWVVVGGHGVGALVVAALLAGRQMIARQNMATRGRRLVMAWTLFPMLVGAGAVLILAVALALLPDLMHGDQAAWATMARWIIPSQAVILMTTAVPAGAVEICQKLTLDDS